MGCQCILDSTPLLLSAAVVVLRPSLSWTASPSSSMEHAKQALENEGDEVLTLEQEVESAVPSENGKRKRRSYYAYVPVSDAEDVEPVEDFEGVSGSRSSGRPRRTVRNRKLVEDVELDRPKKRNRRQTERAKNLVHDLSSEEFDKLLAEAPPAGSRMAKANPVKWTPGDGEYQSFFWHTAEGRLYPLEEGHAKTSEADEELLFKTAEIENKPSPASQPPDEFLLSYAVCVEGRCDWKPNVSVYSSKVHYARCAVRKSVEQETGAPDALRRFCELLIAEERRRASSNHPRPPAPTSRASEETESEEPTTPAPAKFVPWPTARPSSNIPLGEPEPIFHWQAPAVGSSSSGTQTLGHFTCSFCNGVATACPLPRTAPLEYNVSVRRHMVECKTMGPARGPLLRLWDDGKDLGNGAWNAKAGESNGKLESLHKPSTYEDIKRLPSSDARSALAASVRPTQTPAESRASRVSSMAIAIVAGVKAPEYDTTRIARSMPGAHPSMQDRMDRQAVSRIAPARNTYQSNLHETPFGKLHDRVPAGPFSATTGGVKAHLESMSAPRLVKSMLATGLPPPDDSSELGSDTASIHETETPFLLAYRTWGAQAELAAQKATPPDSKRGRKQKKVVEVEVPSEPTPRLIDVEDDMPLTVRIHDYAATSVRITYQRSPDSPSAVLHPYRLQRAIAGEPITLSFFDIPAQVVRESGMLTVLLESDSFLVPSESSILLDKDGDLFLDIRTDGVTWRRKSARK